MKRMIMLAVMALLALSLALPASAQPSNWSLYLLNSGTQQLLRLYLNGSQQSYDLGLAPGSSIGQHMIDFTADGNRAAYCAIVNTPDGAQAFLTIKDLTNPAAQPFNVAYGVAQGCYVNFSDDASQIALGLVHYYASDPNADPSIPAWQLLVLDAGSGALLHEMDASKSGSIFDPTRTIMPEVRYFANNQIVFAGLTWGADGSPTSPAYFWQLGNDTIQAIDRWWHNGLDSLAHTGELVWTELDANTPAAQPGGPMPQANTVKLADKSGQERVIYAIPDWVLMETKFIDNGRQLAISELQAFDPNSTPGNQATRWIALDRSGNASELATTLGFSQVAAAPDGYVILTASDNSAAPVLTLEYHTGRETTPLWQQQESSGSSWSLLWAAPTATADGLQAFPTVTQ